MNEAGDAESSIGLAGLLAQLENLLGRERISDDFVRFRIDLAQAQSRIRGNVTAAAPRSSNATVGRTAFDADSLMLNEDSLKEYFDDLCAAVERRSVNSDYSTQLRKGLSDERDRLGELLRLAGLGSNLAYLEGLAESLAIPQAILLFLAHTLASPFVAAHRRNQLKEVVIAESPAGSCPFCGAAPALSLLRRDDGKRSLWCSLCGLEYFFKRVGCPFCGCEEQAELGLLYVDEREKQWIECCERCKQYIKVFDARKADESWRMSPYFEESATLYLDLLAEREGYTRRLSFTPAL